MLLLPPTIMTYLAAFAPLFSSRIWRHVPLLVAGAILAPGRRMMSSVLRVVGLSQMRSFQTYHRVLNRAKWSSLGASRILLRLLLAMFAPTGPLLFGLDETIERRRGAKIAAAGIYRDPVRSSHRHFVKVNGLRWVCLMLLVPIPWAARVWALPFLTVLAPSERYAQVRGQPHKPVTTWARQMICLLHRWCPSRLLVIVGDRGYAALELLAATRHIATLVTRLRLDARLFTPAPPRKPRQNGRPRVVGKRLPTLEQIRDDATTLWTALSVPRWYGEQSRIVEIVSETAVWYHTGKPPVPIRWVLIRDPRGTFPTQALLCTDLEATPLQILSWFVLRWQLEVTFHAVREHLGVETQRQWSHLAILRTTPALLGLFSLVTVLAHEPMSTTPGSVRQTAWYAKTTPTFADALALVRRQLWTQSTFCLVPPHPDVGKVPYPLLEHLSELLCYAA
jgi:DDE superfamily endonuclease